ncbi:endo-1,4-beta-xylanase [Euzebyella marina]|uniref:Beta-xylanase n=1 Tax=Euzebyella marina TaxID=1761453 RepID=A0A3G2L247_9FLAO|nr:endo-1,4-beta-xylanase [Euzebyella marina]AYN66330.1 endo-1,4-beta-xylanase [Euzebyella marina]
MIQLSRFLIFFFIIVFWLLLGCKNSEKVNAEVDESKAMGLSDAFVDDFYMGVAVNGRLIDGVDSLGTSLLKREFNSITPENIMKWMYIHPEEDGFDFQMSDKYVAMGQRDSSFIVGHTLVWHSQLADWVEEVSDSTEMVEVLRHHINAIMGRYKGKIQSWDVVNEALNEDGTLRESVFLKTIGPQYLDLAFRLASEVDPDAQLTYNDYNLTAADKRKGAISIVKNLKSRGIKIDVVGMQGHWNLKGPTLEEIEQSIVDYYNAGVKVAITELDITVLPNPWDLEGAEVSQNFEGDEKMNPFPQSLPDSVEQQLASRYKSIFQLFLKHREKIDRVTFWGIQDGASWLNGWPIRNRTNYPLLFDRNYSPKAAYHEVMGLKK